MNKPLFSEIRHPKKRAFLGAFAETASILHASKKVGIDRHNHALWLHKGPIYTGWNYMDRGKFLEETTWMGGRHKRAFFAIQPRARKWTPDSAWKTRRYAARWAEKSQSTTRERSAERSPATAIRCSCFYSERQCPNGIAITERAVPSPHSCSRFHRLSPAFQKQVVLEPFRLWLPASEYQLPASVDRSGFLERSEAAR